MSKPTEFDPLPMMHDLADQLAKPTGFAVHSGAGSQVAIRDAQAIG